MGQAGRTRGKNGRRLKRKATVDQGLRTNAEWEAEMRRARQGVVPGAEKGKEMCPVCQQWSEGWYIEGGKRTWYHFARVANCVEKYDHIEGPGAVPGVW